MYFVGYFDKMSRRVVAEVMVYQSVVGCIWLKFLRVLVYMTAVSRTLGFVYSLIWLEYELTVVDTHTNSPVFTIQYHGRLQAWASGHLLPPPLPGNVIKCFVH